MECVTDTNSRSKGPTLNVEPSGMNLHRHLLVQARFLELQRQDLRGEGRAIDRALQLRPQPGDGTQMIFMRVGEHDAVQGCACRWR